MSVPMQGRYLNVDAQLAAHPDIERVTTRFWGMLAATGGGMLVFLVTGVIALVAGGRGLEAAVVLPLGLVAVLLALLFAWLFQAGGAGPRPGGDHRGTWRVRSTGAPLTRVWNQHWNVWPQYHAWLYGELSRGNLDALLRIGPGTGWNFGEVYLALYAAPRDRVAYLVMSTKTGERLGVDTGWRPIELRGPRYDDALARLQPLHW